MSFFEHDETRFLEQHLGEERAQALAHPRVLSINDGNPSGGGGMPLTTGVTQHDAARRQRGSPLLTQAAREEAAPVRELLRVVSRRDVLKHGLAGALVILGLPWKTVTRSEAGAPQPGRHPEGNSLFLIGMIHGDPEDNVFQASLVGKASHGEVAVGVEGVERSEVKERNFVHTIYGLDNRGLVFGIEDDFANQYAGVLLHYGYLANRMTDQGRLAKLQLLYDLRESAARQQNWTQTGAQALPPSAQQVYQHLERYRREHEQLDLKTFVVQAQELLDQWGDEVAWTALFKALAEAMTEEVKGLPPDEQLELQQIQAYLADPIRQDAQRYIVDEINGRWRDQKIVKHIHAVAEIAADRGVSAYFLIGQGHVQQLSASLAASHRGLVKRVYQRTHFVPKEYRP